MARSIPAWTTVANDCHRKELVEICVKKFCNSNKFADVLDKKHRTASISQCGEPIIKLLINLSNSITDLRGDYLLIVSRLEDLIALSTEKFYAYPFKDVPGCWRELFREASVLKVSALAVNSIWEFPKNDFGVLPDIPPWEETVIDEMVRTIDTALIMAGLSPSMETRDAIDAVLVLLQKCTSENSASEDHHRTTKRRKLEQGSQGSFDCFPTTTTAFVPPISNPIARTTSPSMEAFVKHMSKPNNDALGPEPIILCNVLENWPARGERSWSKPSYLLSETIGGRRLVPIETGRSYTDDGWGQKIITFKEFLDQYVCLTDSSNLATGYLAQHDLFAQMPSLRNDIVILDYCFVDPPSPHHSSPLAQKHSEVPVLDEPLLNAWFGPAGTISPLHTDPYHNILAQVVGSKYVRLYAPGESTKLYPRGLEEGGVDMSNTSAIDIGVLAGWDGIEEEQNDGHLKFPLFKEAGFVDCILEEGECLYIPVGWWHYVRSVSVSFSVSFWFN